MYLTGKELVQIPDKPYGREVAINMICCPFFKALLESIPPGQIDRVGHRRNACKSLGLSPKSESFVQSIKSKSQAPDSSPY